MKVICCETARKLGEQYAEGARLYAESVVVLTSNHATVSQDEYIRLREAAEKARQRSEALGIAYEEHVESHRRGGETSRIGPAEATLEGRTEGPGSVRDPHVH
jgi:hypothetical protein